jgi:hypothetical protein
MNASGLASPHGGHTLVTVQLPVPTKVAVIA